MWASTAAAVGRGCHIVALPQCLRIYADFQVNPLRGNVANLIATI